MKKILTFIVSAIMIFAAIPVCAASSADNITIEYLEDGSRYITIIENNYGYNTYNTNSTTVTKNKKTYYQNSSGENLWYVKVTGTFRYGSGTSVCTKSEVEAKSLNSNWKITNSSASKSGNTASATATAKKYTAGVAVDTKTKTVMLKCSSTGEFS